MHHAALHIILAPITEDLVAIQDGPMIFEAISLGLEVTFTLKEDSLLVISFIRSTEAFVDLTFVIV